MPGPLAFAAYLTEYRDVFRLHAGPAHADRVRRAAGARAAGTPEGYMGEAGAHER